MPTDNHSILPGTSRLICIASKTYPRYSEADIIELSTGRLLLAQGRKEKSSDFAPSSIIGQFSRDRGLSWDDEPHVIQRPFDDVTGIYSVSLARSPRGVHLFFLARGPDPKSDTRIYQLLSADEAKTWPKPQKVNTLAGYHIVNNARVIRTSKGRMIVPSAYVDRSIDKAYDEQRILCYYSDDDGVTWKQSSVISLDKSALMEPGVAECADGSFYMTIRTKLGVLYEARSRDHGKTWVDFGPSKLPAPAAPSTVVRDPASDDLWMFWCPSAGADWKGRTPQLCAVSHDHGQTWSDPRPIETDPQKSFGYISVTVIDKHVLLTYYDWKNQGQPNFQFTNLRQRTIPLAWFHGKPVPPIFQTRPEPVLSAHGKIVSINSGVVVQPDRWRLWFTTGTSGPKGEQLNVSYAQSADQGLTWTPPADCVFANSEKSSIYHPSVHRDGANLIAYVWRRDAPDDSGLYRYVSSDDGKSFTPDPTHPLFVSNWTKFARLAEAGGQGHVSNDAFDVLHDENGTYNYFAAVLEKAADPRAVIKHDNAPGLIRLIGRAASRDGAGFDPIDIIIRPDYSLGDPPDTQVYGIHVFRYRRFYLGLLHVFHADSQIIQPEWAWSHDGISWSRTRTPCIALGDEARFDCRMIVFGQVIITGDELVYLYTGYDKRHDAFKSTDMTSSIGRATLSRREFEKWLDTLPQP